MSEIISQVELIFRDLFENDSLLITENTTADDIEDWDSITHIQLLVSIEKQFNITFTSLEIIQFKNVGDIVNCIAKK